MYNITSMPQGPIKNNIYFHSFRPAGATFEELCHNYTQERLQLLFHQKTITALKERYSQAKPSLLWSSAVVFFLTFTQLPSWAWCSRIIRHAARTVRFNAFYKKFCMFALWLPFLLTYFCGIPFERLTFMLQKQNILYWSSSEMDFITTTTIHFEEKDSF